VIINTKEIPSEIWSLLAAHGSDNTIARLCKKSNGSMFNELAMVKKIYDQFIDFQRHFIIVPIDKDLDIEPRKKFSGNFSINNFEVNIVSPKPNCIINFDFDKTEKMLIPKNYKSGCHFLFYSSSKKEFSKNPIKKIKVTGNDSLNSMQHSLLQKAAKYANIFYDKIQQEKQLAEQKAAEKKNTKKPFSWLY
jgi:hypothetical protein